MVAESLQSPNAIPARTSSSGMTNGHTPTKPVLKPVAEADWLSPSHKNDIPIVPTNTTMTDSPIPPHRHPKRLSTSDRKKYRDNAAWTPEKDAILLGPYSYLIATPGKDIRKQFIAAFNTLLAVPPTSLDTITKVITMLHTASLLVDDVEDSSELRRGIPVAHAIFGVPQTINSANYVYFLALAEVSKLTNPSNAIDIFTKELLNLHRGQGMDLFWRDTLTCPSETDYLEMVSNKTGGLFRLAVKLMQAESTANTTIDCVPLVNLMGSIFQICDDYLNLSSSAYTKRKGLCEDLTEGKFSFPIIHSIRSNPENLQLINILKQKTKDEEVKRYAVKYMEGTGSFEYTRQVIKELKEKARGMIDALDEGTGQGECIRIILDKMDVDAQ